MSREYAVWLTPLSKHNKAVMPEYWRGRAINVTDALVMARAAFGNASGVAFWKCRVEAVQEKPSNALVELVE
jgi:hypothetical protein